MLTGLAQTTVRTYRFKNGIRLAGASGPRGRLEVSSRDAWFAPDDGRIGWSPVCDSDDFTDELAEDMCQMLLYTYGRKFYSPLITYRKNETGVRYVGKIVCTPNVMSPPPPPGRRPPPPQPVNASPSPSPAVLNYPPPSPPTSPDQPAPTSPSSPSPSSPSPSSPSPSSPSPSSPSPSSPSPSSPSPLSPSSSSGSGRRHRRQLLRDVDGDIAAAVDGATVQQHHQGRGTLHHSSSRRRAAEKAAAAARRSLYLPVMGNIASPRSAPYSCSIRPGACDVKGPFVGIECSNTPLVDAPPPPPSPPAPPPAPPAVSETIRMYGPPLSPNSIVYGDVESNLNDQNMLGNFYGRFDVQVNASGVLTWAPLCAPPVDDGSDPYAVFVLANLLCQQVYNWPKPFDGGIGYVQSQVPYPLTPFPIPALEGPFGPGDFNPNNRIAYASIVGGDVSSARAVQDLVLQVSSSPCQAGLMPAACLPFGERRRHH